MAKGLTYKAAGVDMEAGDRLVEQIREAVVRTLTPPVLNLYGHFAGAFDLTQDKDELFRFREPILVSGTDGVGTKLRVAIDAGRVSGIGQDLVAMCVNDILVLGAQPVFFLDYLATSHLNPLSHAKVVVGIANACHTCSCALLGGETAEMPGFYHNGDFDLAGFAVGVVEKSRIIKVSQVKAGDVLLGLASSGIHSNGYSLVRKIVFDVANLKVEDEIPGLRISVADELLKPTQLYPPAVLPVLRHYGTKKVVHGMAHITGGGIPGNVPRVLPKGLQAVIERKTWPVPPIFPWLQKTGDVPAKEMWQVFNMGIGYVMIVSPFFANHITEMLEREGETVYAIGKVTRGDGEVVLT